MQAVTVKQAGADGVMEAIADGMKAGEYARRVRAVTAENDRLKNDLAAMEAENLRLTNENRNHRFAEERAIQNTLEMQVQDIDLSSYRRWKGAVIFMAGVVVGVLAAFGVLVFETWIGGVL